MDKFDESQLIETYQFQIGDIVIESEYINPFQRKCWIGIVVFIERRYYEFELFNDLREDLVGVHWFQPNYVETLPSSVLRLVNAVKQKDDDGA